MLAVLCDPDVKVVIQALLLLVLNGLLSDKSARIAFSGLANSDIQPLPDFIHSRFDSFCDQAGNGCPKGTSPLLSYLANAGPDKALLVTFSLFLFSLQSLPVRSGLRLCCSLTIAYCHLMLIRALLVTFTTLPSPSPLCRGVTRLEDLPQSGWFLAPIYCNDLLFSGHATLTTLVVLFVHASFEPRSRSDSLLLPLLKRLGLAAWLAASLLWSVVLRDHYSADVAVAALVSALTFRAFFENEVCREYSSGRLEKEGGATQKVAKLL